ncbi:MAG: hypothetical protein GXO26_01790 [Crenarchaeota archaeon]|nr:hypothetical protein [Thermoproteota archaeon]
MGRLASAQRSVKTGDESSTSHINVPSRVMAVIGNNPFLSNVEEKYRGNVARGLAYFNYYGGKVYGENYLSAFRRCLGLALLNLANLVNSMYGINYEQLLKRKNLRETLSELYSGSREAMFRLVRYNPFLYEAHREGNELYIDFSGKAGSPYSEEAWKLFNSTVGYVRNLGVRGGGEFFYRIFPYLTFSLYTFVPRYAYAKAMNYLWEKESQFPSGVVYLMGVGAYGASVPYSAYYSEMSKRLGKLWREIQSSL